MDEYTPNSYLEMFFPNRESTWKTHMRVRRFLINLSIEEDNQFDHKLSEPDTLNHHINRIFVMKTSTFII